jgi:DNA-binding transcriptional LysR family regulator
MLDARRLATLQAVARAGSFARAAATLGYTQSAVSQHVSELERSVGLRLLERRPVRLTDAGAVAVAAAESIGNAIAAAESLLDRMRSGTAGHVRLGAFASAASAIAAPALATFADTHPDVSVTLIQVEPPQAYDALISGELDLALVFDYDLAPHTPPAQIARTLLAKERLLAALPTGHPLAVQESVTLRMLASEPWIAAPLAGLPLDALRAGNTTGFRPRLRFVGDDFATVVALVAHGVGAAVVPQLAAGLVGDGVLLKPLDDAPLQRRLYTARLQTDFPFATASALETVIKQTVGERARLPRLLSAENAAVR